MSLTLHILQASGRLTAIEAGIHAAFEAVGPKVAEVLEIPDVDVVVVDDPDSAIPETGSGGFAPNAHTLFVYLDPEHENLKEHLDEEIQGTIAHELHHCARWQTVGYGNTLLEAIVSEGLADHFDIEVNGGQPRPWSIAFSGDEIAKLREQAAPVFNESYDAGEWLFGTREIPKWAGYSLGFAIVAEHMKRTGKKASELVAEPASAFVG